MEIKIIKSNRKTLSLSVDDDMCAVVKSPYFVTNRRLMLLFQKMKHGLKMQLNARRKSLKNMIYAMMKK